MDRRRTIAVVVAAGATVLGTAAAAGTTTSAGATPAFSTLAHSMPTWTAHATYLGAARSAQPVGLRVYLAPHGGLAALQKFAVAASTPGTAQYRHFLTNSQYQRRFGTRDAAVARVSRFLDASGLHVIRVAHENHYVVARGTVAAAEQAFHTTLGRYRYQGHVVRAPQTAERVPTYLAGDVTAVLGLDTLRVRAEPAAPAGFRNARPCSSYYGQIQAKYQADYSTPLPKFPGSGYLPYTVCGYTGPFLRAAYEGNTTLDGTGATVAITDAYASPTIAQDANTYAESHGDGSYAPGQLRQRLRPSYDKQGQCQGGEAGWAAEETLDVEAVHAMAPGANIRYYSSRSCFDNDFLNTLQRVVDDDVAQLCTDSWADLGEGVPAGTVAAYDEVLMEGAAKGISFMFSSGDDGDNLAASGAKSANFPTSDPYITGVGGTSTAIGPTGKLEWQTGWGTDKWLLNSDGSGWTDTGFLYGAGGGSSSLFNRPSYQDGFTHSAARQVPDVAMDADPNTGMLIGLTQSFPDGKYYDEYRIGGTSLASPLFTGMTALAVENSGGKGFGLLNPTIYANAASDFIDVRGRPHDAGNVRVDYVNSVDSSDGYRYSVRTFDQDSSLMVKPGYDQVTGVGVPNPNWLTVAASTS